MARFFMAMAIILVVVVLFSTKGETLDNPLPADATADKILIEKSRRRLTLLSKNQPLKSYHISLGRDPVGKKAEEGDGRTPEGNYSIDGRKLKSRYHRALHISYPNAEDTAQAKARGVSPGDDIMIHGRPNLVGLTGTFQAERDWTSGSIAVSNPEIEEISRVVSDGTKVEILP